MLAGTFRFHTHAADALRVIAMATLAVGVGVWSALLLAPRPVESPPLLAPGADARQDLSPVVQWFGGAPLRVRVAVNGIIAAGDGSGAALLSVDGASPRAYRVSQELAPGVVLEAVSPQSVSIAQDGVAEQVPMPKAPGSGMQGFVPVARPQQ
ncbi:MAG TPA: hypothetical protein VKZ70_02885 [Burkholderiaceae bacterium]|nr:hypothetical protein [Burkholderiaceae bacterium]